MLWQTLVFNARWQAIILFVWNTALVWLWSSEEGSTTLGCVWVCVWPCTNPLLAAAQHQEGFNVVLLQVSIPLSSKSRLHLIVPIKILQRGVGDVDTPTNERTDTHHVRKQPVCGCLCQYIVSGGVGRTNPAFPPASIWLASVTSLDQTSNCHLRRPSTPQWTRPLWMPTRMFTLTPVTSLTSLQMHTHTHTHSIVKKIASKIGSFIASFQYRVSKIIKKTLLLNRPLNHVISNHHMTVRVRVPALS